MKYLLSTALAAAMLFAGPAKAEEDSEYFARQAEAQRQKQAQKLREFEEEQQPKTAAESNAKAVATGDANDTEVCRIARGEINRHVIEGLKAADECEKLKIAGPEAVKQHSVQQAEAQRLKQAQRQEWQTQIDKLFNGYISYAYVKLCNDVRQGYLVQYVNDIELERAEIAVKAIAARAVRVNNSDEVWEEAVRIASKRKSINEFDCKRELNGLLQSSPVSVYKIEKP